MLDKDIDRRSWDWHEEQRQRLRRALPQYFDMAERQRRYLASREWQRPLLAALENLRRFSDWSISLHVTVLEGVRPFCGQLGLERQLEPFMSLRNPPRLRNM